MNKMSIIVPIYNVEKYLSRCLDSIIAQSMNDVEVICVEDCSTDNSRMILKEYEKRNLIKVIYNEANVGLGQARNIGMTEATGAYVWFVDSDDWIETNSVQELYDIANSNNLDILYFGVNQVYEDSIAQSNSGYNNSFKAEIKEPMSGEEALRFLSERCSYDGTAWRKIYRKSLIEEIRFPSDVFHEDEIFSLKAMIKARHVMAVTNRYYNYYRRVNSITIPHSGLTEKHCVSVAKMVYDVGELIREYSGCALDTLHYIYAKMSCSLSDGFRNVDSFSREYLKKWNSIFNIIEMVGGTFYNGFFPRKLSPEVMSVLRKSKKIYIYGAGKVGQGLYKLLKERRIMTDCFIVTNESAENLYEETPIISIEKLSEDMFDEAVFLVAMVDIEACELVESMLIRNGVDKKSIYNYYELR